MSTILVPPKAVLSWTMPGGSAVTWPMMAAVSSGLRFCEAIGLQPEDLDLDEGIPELARSVVKVSPKHHPQGKTFLVREYTKNGSWRRIKLDRPVVELVRAHVTLIARRSWTIGAADRGGELAHHLPGPRLQHCLLLVGQVRGGARPAVTAPRSDHGLAALGSTARTSRP